MPLFEIPENGFPSDTLFEFNLGCLGCNNGVQVIFEDGKHFDNVEARADDTDTPRYFSVNNSESSQGGAYGGRCNVRDKFSTNVRRFVDCPKKQEINDFTEQVSQLEGLIIERWTK